MLMPPQQADDKDINKKQAGSILTVYNQKIRVRKEMVLCQSQTWHHTGVM